MSARLFLRSVLAVVALLVILLIVLYAFQRDLIYPARRYDESEMHRLAERNFQGRATLIEPFDALAVEPAMPSPIRATALWFHGNGDVNVDLASLVPVFADRGLRLILAEYPGYGARPGLPTEPTLVDDARALFRETRRRYPNEPILVVGQSLGSGVAVQVAASESPGPQRLVLITPYLSLPETVARVVWMLPVRRLVKDHYDSFAALPRYTGPIGIVTAGRDALVGAEQGRLLAGQARQHSETTEIRLPDATHDSWPSQLTPEMWTLLLGFAPLQIKRP